MDEAHAGPPRRDGKAGVDAAITTIDRDGIVRKSGALLSLAAELSAPSHAATDRRRRSSGRRPAAGR
ncbi:hypothetical protein [uncultured Piscinibacter sp.]|uniref:hypothetical protein n=1 Tax=uncultured Piscinibacter sp. TaxID=1131835 RepID=UPI00262CD869|nr:hypothetical protein [uncultured Piscinibacter sp.]